MAGPIEKSCFALAQEFVPGTSNPLIQTANKRLVNDLSNENSLIEQLATTMLSFAEHLL
jgi:hypothetical protein